MRLVNQLTRWMTTPTRVAIQHRSSPQRSPIDAHTRSDMHPRPRRVAVVRVPPESVSMLQLSVNGAERTIPLRLTRREQVAALRRGARLASEAGGIEAALCAVPVLAARIALPGAAPFGIVDRRVAALAGDLLQIGMDTAHEAGVPIGCIPGLLVSEPLCGRVSACLYTRRVDEPSADALRAVAEALVRPLACLAECDGIGLVESFAAQHECVKARCRIKVTALLEDPAAARWTDAQWTASWPALRRALELDRFDPRFAAAHNAWVLEAMAGAADALRLDPRLWALEARRYAGRWGSCEPLVRWTCARRDLCGELSIPLLRRLELAMASSEPAGASPMLRSMADAMIQLVCVGLSASLAFYRPWWQARMRELLHPAAAPAGHRERDAPSPERSSESGVRRAIRHAPEHGSGATKSSQAKNEARCDPRGPSVH